MYSLYARKNHRTRPPPQHLHEDPPQRLDENPPQRLDENPPQRLNANPPRRPNVGPPRGFNEDPVNILVMGATGAGKSTFIAHATGKEIVIGHSQEFSTSEVYSFQIPCTNVWLVDTPGFDDTSKGATVLDNIDMCLADLFRQKHKIAGVIYIHPITEVRMKGSAMKNLSMFRKVVGKDNMSSCCLVTTKWSLQESAVSESREDEIRTNPKFWQPLLARGAKIARFGDSMESAINIIKPLINGRGFTPQITIETQVQGKRLVDTEAGREVNVNLEEAVKAHKSDMEGLKKLYEQAITDRDAELSQLIEVERQSLAAEIGNMKSERKVLQETIEERPRNRGIMETIAMGIVAFTQAAQSVQNPKKFLYGDRR